METKAIGLYVHIPFCVKKCNYCDFCSFPYEHASWRSEYVDCLCKEIRGYKGKNICLNTIFFGGGTPSLLSPTEFKRIFSAIEESFVISPDTEFTIESNPKTIDADKISAYMDCGVNRISFGLQSIHENELKILGRIHNFQEFLVSYNLARDSGIKNVSIDIMYGLPEQTLDSFSRTLERVIELNPDHISVYGLILEEGTPLYEVRSFVDFPSEDEECDMYYLAAEMLKTAGYNHYEISNYAKAGMESRHNLKYWHCDEYIGVGLAAYSYFEGKRFGNSDDSRAYLSADGANYIRNEDDSDEKIEYVMLRLRLAEGFSISDYKNRFGVDFISEHQDIINELVKIGLVNLSDDRISLTEKGFYVSNSILAEFI